MRVAVELGSGHKPECERGHEDEDRRTTRSKIARIGQRGCEERHVDPDREGENEGKGAPREGGRGAHESGDGGDVLKQAVTKLTLQVSRRRRWGSSMHSRRVRFGGLERKTVLPPPDTFDIDVSSQNHLL
ncbi:hypothetical protein CVT25_006390 [Psilocybe cyanescens]|uniref:Uncharacterized protein n=1 Tax=Psilocybe cyanescens TaxID=93625 RepID=A0A409XKJ7_PSICY|nr:hypothetical protein CVT25_006390 [Psilocybe cyanescens]